MNLWWEYLRCDHAVRDCDECAWGAWPRKLARACTAMPRQFLYTRKKIHKKRRFTKITCCVSVAGSPSRFPSGNTICRLYFSLNKKGQREDWHFNKPPWIICISSRKGSSHLHVILITSQTKDCKRGREHTILTSSYVPHLIVPAQITAKILKECGSTTPSARSCCHRSYINQVWPQPWTSSLLSHRLDWIAEDTLFTGGMGRGALSWSLARGST